MKICAVGDRGTKRDFIDLFFLSKHFTLEQMLDFYNQKFSDLEDKKYHLIKSLNYFEDAEVDAKPNMLIDIQWNKMKSFFHTESMRLAKLNNF